MKYIQVIIFIFSTQFCFGQHFAQKQLHFSASGDAILRIQPDQVALNLGVINRNKDLVQAKLDNYTIINKVLQYCKDNGIPDKYIQTDYISISPHFEYTNNMTPEYYIISQSISIIIEDMTKYEIMLTDLLTIGINRVNNIQFRTTEIEKHRTQVRKMAIQAAKDKAEFLTSEVGINLGEIINIRETITNPKKSFSGSNYANVSRNTSSEYSSEGKEGISIGLISIKATVTLTYQLKE